MRVAPARTVRRVARDGVGPRLSAEVPESLPGSRPVPDEETQQEFSTDPFADFSER